MYHVSMSINKGTFSVHLDIEFSDEDVDLYIMGSWCFAAWWWLDTKTMADRGSINIIAESPDGDGSIEKTVTFDEIRRVMGNICVDAYPRPEFYSLAKRQIMDGIRTGDWDFDADGADQIMQVTVYGKVIFG